MRLYSLLVIMILAIGACKSNPYPDGQYTSQKQAREVIVKNMVLDVPATVRFTEGVTGSFAVKGRVPSPGIPVITFDGLPAGAIYSEADQTVTWKPDYNAANDPNKPNSTTRNYEVTVTMYNSAIPTEAEIKKVVLEVNDMPRTFMLQNLTATDRLSEGLAYSSTFAIQDDDYPNGPFIVTEANAPAGVTFTQDPKDPKSFTINFLPGYDLVKVDSSSTYLVKDFHWTLMVLNPHGRTIVTSIVWTVDDTRQDGLYVGPTDLTTTSHEASFVFMAQDPNLEEAPTVTADSEMLGTVEVTPLTAKNQSMSSKSSQKSNSQTPSQTFQVKWVGIPDSEAGKTEPLVLNICVYNSDHLKTKCTVQRVSVTFNFTVAVPIPSPVATPAPAPAPTPDPTPTMQPGGGSGPIGIPTNNGGQP